ncbi:MAG: UDP-N-acetylmuramate--L-alanine ligase [Eubacteriales bacterium]
MNKTLSNYLTEVRHVHFIGIGGISMSALAFILCNKGYIVSGSDIRESDLTRRLREKGAAVYIGHRPENIQGAQVVINTAAVKEDNAEMKAARAAGIPIFERAVLLGAIMKQYGYPIAIAGTHGKTTTTAMTSEILLAAGKDPSCLVGGQLSTIGGNVRIGQSDYLVCEACEYVDSFLNFYPRISVILNIDNDHLDYFQNLDNIKRSFFKFVTLTGRDGFCVANGDDPNTMEVVSDALPKVITYGVENDSCDVVARNIKKSDTALFAYDLYIHGEFQCEIHLNVPGRHNISNSLAAAACAYLLDVEPASIAAGLNNFHGTKRRFEYIGRYREATIVDDYAHHPTEIAATLRAAKDLHYRRVICLFQPHTYTRTIALMDEFAQALSLCDQCIVADVYAAREQRPQGFTCQTLADRIPGSLFLDSFDKIRTWLDQNLEPDDLVLTMGAGDICTLAYSLCQPS